MKNAAKQTTGVLLLVSVLLLIVAFLPMFGYVLNEQCEAAGWAAQLKSNLQGPRFWGRQLKYLEAEIEMIEAPANIEGNLTVDELGPLLAQMERMKARVDSILEDSYQRNPASRPTPLQIEAQRLRAQSDSLYRVADAINWLEAARWRMQLDQERLQTLHICKPIVAERANQ